jgi:hypothetical protein
MSIWARSENARTYDNVVFDTSDVVDKSSFNLYRGLAITIDMSEQNDVQAAIFIKHIHDIWCRGDQDMTDYVLNTFAFFIQKVGIKTMTAIVLKGGQGAGKGIIIQKLAQIIGNTHFIHMTDVDDLLGQFQNEKFLTNLLTFVDECTFAGDKKQASKLKAHMSESTRKYEQKFVNALYIKNLSNHIFATNYENTVDVEKDDRRWVMLELLDIWAGVQNATSQAYFKALLNVPAEAVAYMLYHRDISNFNPKQIPQTAYQRHQKELNFDTINHWICNALRTKKFTFPEVGVFDINLDEDDCFASNDSLYQSYVASATHASMKHHRGGVATSQQLFKSLIKIMGPEMTVCRYEHARGKRFSNLDKCRKMFERHVNSDGWDWE